MLKCQNCGYNLAGNSSSLVGDKNVIGGDVIGSKTDYNIAGNATIINNSHKFNICHECGKHLAEDQGFTCQKCGEIICSDCYDIKKKMCPSCIKENKAYRVGDVGPAGGFIFYDKGSYSDGWRFLEASPEILDCAFPWVDIRMGTSAAIPALTQN